jgi:hypothetical protein
MSSFEEFLKKKSIDAIFGHVDLNVVSTEDLGEWAWQKIKDGIEFFMSEYDFTPKSWVDDFRQEKHNAEMDFNFELFEIAVGCLGKKEIEKRLKGLV